MGGGDTVVPRGGGVVDGVQLAFVVTLASSATLLASSNIGRASPTLSVPGVAPASNRGRGTARDKAKIM